MKLKIITNQICNCVQASQGILKKTSIIFTFLFVLSQFGNVKAQMPFPISLDANGGKVFVESMDVGPTGDIYVTGSVKNYVSIGFGPGVCGDNVYESEPTGGDRIFVARLHPDPVDSAFDELVWMVIGTSTAPSTGGIFSGKDIEVNPTDGTVYYTGTLIGDVEFKNVETGTTIYSCFSGLAFRHFVSRISEDGEPEWVAEADPGDMMMNSYGEGITLDIPNGRLFTGGYVGNAIEAPLKFPDADIACAPVSACEFEITPTFGSPTVGFVTQYNLDGATRQAFQIGEKVMALDMDDLDVGHLWVTGSIFNTDSDVLLSKIPVNIITPLCANYAPLIFPITGPDGDIGLDIAFTSDNHIAFTGAFETECFFPGPGGGSIFTPPGMSDLFVASFNTVSNSFSGKTSTSGLAPFSATTQSYTLRNSCIAADPFSTSRIIIGYDKDVALDDYSDEGYIITKELSSDLGTTFGTTAASVQIGGCCTPIPVNPAARAMEIDYGMLGSSEARYLAGDYNADLTIGACSLSGTGSWNDGYVGRISIGHDLFYRQSASTDIEGSFSIYPNPSSHQIAISYMLDENSNDNAFHIYNLKGQLVHQEKLTGSVGRNEIVLESNLSNGTYLIQLIDEKGSTVETKKLVIIN